MDCGIRDGPRCTMDGISWADLDEDEQRTIAMLMDSASHELCDPVALLTLSRRSSDAISARFLWLSLRDPRLAVGRLDV